MITLVSNVRPLRRFAHFSTLFKISFDFSPPATYKFPFKNTNACPHRATFIDGSVSNFRLFKSTKTPDWCGEYIYNRLNGFESLVLSQNPWFGTLTLLAMHLPIPPVIATRSSPQYAKLILLRPISVNPGISANSTQLS